jgi:CheY-like chemotaxis protein
MKDFSETAKGLARNPLGIIALFIVLVYGFASLVTAFAGSFTPAERIPMVYFLILFPVIVLGVFAWLVSRHSGKLFAPSDFRNEENYVRMQLKAVASLTAASVKEQIPTSDDDIQRIVDSVRKSVPASDSDGSGWKNQILRVDDIPDNNVYERQAFQAIGLRFTLALSTQEALDLISENRYAAIISDMGRKEGPREGYVFLDALRKEGNKTPFFIYAGSNAPEHKREAKEHGGQGSTNNPQELFQMVTRAIIQS